MIFWLIFLIYCFLFYFDCTENVNLNVDAWLRFTSEIEHKHVLQPDFFGSFIHIYSPIHPFNGIVVEVATFQVANWSRTGIFSVQLFTNLLPYVHYSIDRVILLLSLSFLACLFCSSFHIHLLIRMFDLAPISFRLTHFAGPNCSSFLPNLGLFLFDSFTTNAHHPNTVGCNNGFLMRSQSFNQFPLFSLCFLSLPAIWPASNRKSIWLYFCTFDSLASDVSLSCSFFSFYFFIQCYFLQPNTSWFNMNQLTRSNVRLNVLHLPHHCF